jgi:hypothetical protein
MAMVIYNLHVHNNHNHRFATRAYAVAQVLEHLPSKYEVLSSNSTTAKIRIVIQKQVYDQSRGTGSTKD